MILLRRALLVMLAVILIRHQSSFGIIFTPMIIVHGGYF